MLIEIDEFDENEFIAYFANEGAMAYVTFSRYEEDGFLYGLYSFKRGKGFAKKLLTEINEYCKKEGFLLIIIANPFEFEEGIELETDPNKVAENFRIPEERVIFSTDKNEIEKLKNWYINAGATFLKINKEGQNVLTMNATN